MTATDHPPIAVWLKAMTVLQLGFAVMIGFGAAFEVMNLTMPACFPALQDNPIARVHHAEPVVFAWTLGSNVVVTGIALALAIGAVRMLRGEERGRRLTRVAAITLIAISIGGAIVSAVYLLPLALPNLDSPNEADRVAAILFLSMLASSVIVIPAYPIAALIILGKRSVSALFR